MRSVVISRCCLVTFFKQRQRNEQIIITHAHSAIILVAVTVEACLIELRKSRINGKIMNSQTNAQQTKARPNTEKGAESAENISGMKRIKNFYQSSCKPLNLETKL